MPGVKRKDQSEHYVSANGHQTGKKKVKKVKPAEEEKIPQKRVPNKNKDKYDPVKRKEMTAAKKAARPGQSRVPAQLSVVNKTKPAPVKPAPATPADDLPQSDTTEDENGFYGFSAADEQGGVSLSSADEEDVEAAADVEIGQSKGAKLANHDKNGKEEIYKTGTTTSREAHAKQKALAKERKAARPNADEIQRAKKIWEKLRLKTNVTKEERHKLLTELFEIITGRVKDFVFKHDSVRTIQCALKYATMPQREQIAEELQGSFRDLVESKYSKFLVAKLITEGNEHIRSMIFEECYGHVRKLINHPEASWLLDDAYRQVASSSQKTKLLREWYGPEFTIFKTPEGATVTSEVSAILAETPDKRKPIMDYLLQLINQLIQKKLTGFTMLHDAMLQYYLNIPFDGSEAADFRTMIIGDKEEEEVDLLKNLAFTKSGSQLVCLALAHGSAKERKQILRAYKDTVEMLAFDKHGYLVLLTAYEVVDDTREVAARIFNELVLLTKTASAESQAEKVLALVDHLSGNTVLQYPFVGPAKWLIPAEAQRHLSNVFEIRETTSKKNSKVRQSENIVSLSPPVLATIEAHAATLAQSTNGSILIREALLNGVGDKAAAVDAVAELAAGDPTDETHIANSPAGSRMLKSLVAGGPYDPVAKKVTPIDPPLNFHNALYGRVKEQVLPWATGMGSLVIVALMEADGFEHRAELQKLLKKGKTALQKAATEETTVQKVIREKVAEDGENKKGKKAKGKKEDSVGNRGAQLLLTMLE